MNPKLVSNLVTRNTKVIATSQSSINDTCKFSLITGENGLLEPISDNPHPKCTKLLSSLRDALQGPYALKPNPEQVFNTRHEVYGVDPEK